ncbi:DUF6086 family protein [Streptomyces telluris]|uniref:DUF6086 family protein n=1 Tax=Streptomyces telluris TaxID=2720021 RepID=A0A9X2LNX4_9ACTN|nr:DUF6086 family protein [Streptomyces telluris]MCQ8774797.1 DUF6086 family protein [Streptomyces telluris]
MSQYYDMGDRSLWNAATGVSRLFMGQVSVYEAEVGMPSGIGPMREDECQVDPAVFKVFAEALLAWHCRAIHPVTAALSEGFVVTVLALAGRAAIEVNWHPIGGAEDTLPDGQASAISDSSMQARAAALQVKSRQLVRFMSR